MTGSIHPTLDFLRRVPYFAGLPEINQVLCTGCGECIAACRPGALALADGKAVLARPDVCEYDGGCEPICPEEAINLPYLIVLGDR